MIYQLKNGSSIQLSVEQYLNMTDEELDYLNTHHFGDYIENPWHDSVLGKTIPDFVEEEIIEDLTSISDDEKLLFPDIDSETFLE